MSWREAPLYVLAHDLTLRLSRSAPTAGHPELGVSIVRASIALLIAVSRALTFVDRRRASLRAADEAIADLKVLIRVAEELGGISPVHAREVQHTLGDMGRMVGGWQRRAGRRKEEDRTREAPDPGRELGQ